MEIAGHASGPESHGMDRNQTNLYGDPTTSTPACRMESTYASFHFIFVPILL